MHKVKVHTVDMTKTKGRGEFECPKCGTEISPDDMTEETFVILDTITKGDSLEKIILRCNNCGSQIHITGFHLLEEMKTTF